MDTLAEDLIDVLFVQGESNIAELYRHKLDLDGYRVTLAKPVGDSLTSTVGPSRTSSSSRFHLRTQRASRRSKP